MGFGGGGTGSFALPNHTHTNVTEDGGELEELVSLVDGATLQAWVSAEILSAKPVPASQEVLKSGTFTTTSSTLVDITGMTATLPNNDGKSLVIFQIYYNMSANYDATFDIMDNTTLQNKATTKYDSTINTNSMTLIHIADNDGQAVKLQGNTEASQTLSIYGGGTKVSNCLVLSLQ
jgi:hypothetical protein